MSLTVLTCKGEKETIFLFPKGNGVAVYGRDQKVESYKGGIFKSAEGIWEHKHKSYH